MIKQAQLGVGPNFVLTPLTLLLPRKDKKPDKLFPDHLVSQVTLYSMKGDNIFSVHFGNSNHSVVLGEFDDTKHAIF